MNASGGVCNENENERAKQMDTVSRVQTHDVGSDGRTNIPPKKKLYYDHSVLYNRNTTPLYCDDDSTTTTEISLVESSTSMATTTAPPTTPLHLKNTEQFSALQTTSGDDEAKKRLELQNDSERRTSPVQEGAVPLGGRDRSHQKGRPYGGGQKRRMNVQIERSLQFLQHPSISSLSSFEKEAFLCSKGLSNDVVQLTMETAARKVPVIPSTNHSIDKNTSDGDSNSSSDSDSDTIDSDDYLELSKRNVSYRRTWRKDEDVIRGRRLLPQVSPLRNDSVVDSRKDAVSQEDEQERDHRRNNRRAFLHPLNDDKYHHFESQIQPQTPSILPADDQLHFGPFRLKVVGQLIVMGAVLFGVVFVMILLFHRSSNDAYHFILLRYSSIFPTTSIETNLFNSHLKTKVNTENGYLLSNIIFDETGNVDELEDFKFPLVPTPLTGKVPAKGTNHVVDKRLYSRVRGENDKQQDENLRVCYMEENTLDAPSLAGELPHKDFKGYTNLNKTSRRRNDIQCMEDEEECQSKDSGSNMIIEEDSIHQPIIQNEVFSQETHSFTESMQNPASLHRHGSIIPDTQKLKSKLGRVTDSGIDGEVGRNRSYYRAKKTRYNEIEPRTFSDLPVLAQFSQLKSTMDSLMSELMKQSCHSGSYNGESEEYSHWKCVSDESISNPSTDSNNVLKKLDEISASLKLIESNLINTAGKKDMSNIGNSDTVPNLRNEILFGRNRMHHIEATEYVTSTQQNARQNDLFTNPVNKVTRKNPHWIPKISIPRVLKKSLQILARIVSQFRSGFKFIMRIPWHR